MGSSRRSATDTGSTGTSRRCEAARGRSAEAFPRDTTRRGWRLFLYVRVSPARTASSSQTLVAHCDGVDFCGGALGSRPVLEHRAERGRAGIVDQESIANASARAASRSRSAGFARSVSMTVTSRPGPLRLWCIPSDSLWCIPSDSIALTRLARSHPLGAAISRRCAKSPLNPTGDPALIDQKLPELLRRPRFRRRSYTTALAFLQALRS
jgi:hypothetical protein